MKLPKRIQRSRAKGWRMPEGAVYVGRPTKWGNPFNLKSAAHCWTALAHGFKADRKGRLEASVAIYEAWLLNGRADGVDCGFSVVHKDGRAERVSSSPVIEAPAPPSLAEIRAELHGKDLACWCPLDQPCHADILLRLANEPVAEAEA